MKTVLTRILYLSLCACALSFECTAPALAETFSQSLQQMLMRQYDWILTCHVKEYSNYLSYESSKLPGLVTVGVDYQPTPTGLAGAKAPPAPLVFEELWYSQGKCLGSRRYANLALPKYWQGTIYFADDGSSDLGAHTQEIANTSARLLTFVDSSKSLVSAVVVPNRCFNGTINGLAHWGFHRLESTPVTPGKHISLHVIGYPIQEDSYLFYVPPMQ